jgi:hypothetical protein
MRLFFSPGIEVIAAERMVRTEGSLEPARSAGSKLLLWFYPLYPFDFLWLQIQDCNPRIYQGFSIQNRQSKIQNWYGQLPYKFLGVVLLLDSPVIQVYPLGNL